MKRWFGKQEPLGLADQRARMVDTQLAWRGVKDESVLQAMRTVPRERFLPAELARHAYDDNALPIGQGQTISQPYIVARMSEALDLPAWRAANEGRQPRVLDVGTGSGYGAAVLAQMGAQVFSIELEAQLAERAQRLLDELGYEVRVVVGDGSVGLPQEAPFAGIVVAAAAPQVPQPLVEQLEQDGRLVMPVGSRLEQRIVLVRRQDDEQVIDALEPAVFVPLLGEHGFGQ
ncbi:MAG TPA: protein-L-isoaspartate(D-aspartate) O-methyltransferase [Candidatus Limnocylindria bacterium]|nr:protein-L-isoaspartate(D-aspartate) O-methyltransferase [Candidatus Limnocylindria bacterium]